MQERFREQAYSSQVGLQGWFPTLIIYLKRRCLAGSADVLSIRGFESINGGGPLFW